MRALLVFMALTTSSSVLAQSTQSSSNQSSSNQSSQLPAGEWQLVRAGTLEQTDAAERTNRPTLRIEEGRLTGNTGCNGYSVSYAQTGNMLRLGKIATTRRACPNDVERALEARFLRALSGTARFTVSGPVLLLISRDRQVLSFARAR